MNKEKGGRTEIKHKHGNQTSTIAVASPKAFSKQVGKQSPGP